MVENGTIKKTPTITNVVKCLFQNAMRITMHWELKVVSSIHMATVVLIYEHMEGP